METLAIIALCITTTAALVFVFGPELLERFFDKADEWQEIIERLEEEK